jgi:hypothetical protein
MKANAGNKKEDWIYWLQQPQQQEEDEEEEEEEDYEGRLEMRN